MTLTRSLYMDYGVFGMLVDDAGNQYATLEHAYPDPKGGYTTKLPAGTYVCKRGIHKLHDGKPFETFEILGIKGHSGVLFHVGNYNSDSEGCVLVGLAQSSNMVIHSKEAFRRFMNVLDGVFEFLLEVK